MVGKIYSETQFYKVVKTSGDKVQLVNDLGENIVVDTTYVAKCLQSASDFAETKKVTKTELAEVFMANPRVAMTVCFFKQVKEADITEEIMKAYSGSTPKTMETAIKKAVKKGLEGEERVMVGRHNNSVDDFGRVHFIDMNVDKDPSKTYDTRQRLVDPRTIQYVIVNGIKYELK